MARHSEVGFVTSRGDDGGCTEYTVNSLTAHAARFRRQYVIDSRPDSQSRHHFSAPQSI